MATGAGHDLCFAALYRRTQQPLHNVMHKICKKLIPEEDNFHHTSGQLRAVPPTDNFQVRVMFKSVHDKLKTKREARGDPEVDKYDLPAPEGWCKGEYGDSGWSGFDVDDIYNF